MSPFLTLRILTEDLLKLLSRKVIKKYVLANNKELNAEDTRFHGLFNRALKAGIDNGIFAQPKGASGPTKIAQRPAAPRLKLTNPAAMKIRKQSTAKIQSVAKKLPVQKHKQSGRRLTLANRVVKTVKKQIAQTLPEADQNQAAKATTRPGAALYPLLDLGLPFRPRSSLPSSEVPLRPHV